MARQPVNMDLPEGLVTEGFGRLQSIADAALEVSNEFINKLVEFEVETQAFDVEFEDPFDGAAGFAFPENPVPPDTEFELPEVPEDPELETPEVPSVGDMPTFDVVQPQMLSPSKPSALSVQAPSPAPTVQDVTLPTEPSVTMPDAPSMREISIPSAPTVTLPVFSAEIAEIDFQAPNPSFSYVDPGYSSTLLAEVTSRVRTMLQGGTGLPFEVEEALFGRARVREDMTARKAIQELTEEWSSRGFTLPGGEVSRRISEARQNNQDKVNSLERDILIEAAKWEIDNLRFAVQNGIALETVLINLYNAIQQRAFDVAKFTLQAAIEIFNAQVSLYNVKLQAFTAQAEVFRSLVQAELAKVEVFRAQIEAQKTINEINELDVRIYTQRVQSVLAAVEIYKAQVEAARLRVSVDEARISAFRAEVEAFAAQVGAKKSEYEAWGEEIRAEATKANVFQAQVNAFAERVRAYTAQTEATLLVPKLEVEIQGLKVNQFQARVQSFSAQANAQAQRLAASADIFQGQSQLYSAQVSAESARVQADRRKFEMAVEKSKAKAAHNLAQVQLSIVQVQEVSKQMLQALQSAATVMSQLAAGAMSAVTLGASISGQQQLSEGLLVQTNSDT